MGTTSDCTPGFGWVCLDERHCRFAIVLFHELHCLLRIRCGIFMQQHIMKTPGHVGHCLNYIRQHVLCIASDALEAGDAPGL